MSALVTAEEIARLRAMRASVSAVSTRSDMGVREASIDGALRLAIFEVPRLLDALETERDNVKDRRLSERALEKSLIETAQARDREAARASALLDRCAALEATVLGIQDIERKAREAGVAEGRAAAVRALRRMAEAFDATEIPDPERAKVAAVLRGLADGLEEPKK